ncbi:MAG: hypothetical protein JWP69_112 [Flaviaesturariibacter sp.]|nr:hypothetical protein [Flaviaesturariibacter sp.]
MPFLKSRHILRFTEQDAVILLVSMLPLTVILNLFIFNGRYFSEPKILITASIITFVFLAGFFTFCSSIAVVLRNRLPAEEQNIVRLGASIALYAFLSFLTISILFRLYDFFTFFEYRFNDSAFGKGLACMIVINVFLTFLMEGVSRFEQYRMASQQTEKLQKEYMKSQVLGLKSQMNPHFLFNSLNSLSSLIQEDTDEAETFLNEMSKVYRYLLRNNEEYLVPLETELNFINSYTYLLKARYGDAFHVKTTVGSTAKEYMLPPLTLQMLIENIITQNAISKKEPLQIEIKSSARSLTVTNSILTKLNTSAGKDAGLENISNKYRLLSLKGLTIETSETERIIYLPLIKKEEVVSL